MPLLQGRISFVAVYNGENVIVYQLSLAFGWWNKNSITNQIYKCLFKPLKWQNIQRLFVEYFVTFF